MTVDRVRDREDLLEAVRDVDIVIPESRSAAAPRTGVRSRPHSSAEFGSSRIRTEGPTAARGRARRVAARRSGGTRPDDEVGRRGRPRRAPAALAYHGRARDEAETSRLVAREEIREDRSFAEEAELLVDDADSVLVRLSGVRPRTARRRSGSCPRRRFTAPARIFISVDLPAPFSPTRRGSMPGLASNPTSSSAWTPP